MLDIVKKRTSNNVFKVDLWGLAVANSGQYGNLLGPKSLYNVSERQFKDEHLRKKDAEGGADVGDLLDAKRELTEDEKKDVVDAHEFVDDLWTARQNADDIVDNFGYRSVKKSKSFRRKYGLKYKGETPLSRTEYLNGLATEKDPPIIPDGMVEIGSYRNRPIYVHANMFDENEENNDKKNKKNKLIITNKNNKNNKNKSAISGFGSGFGSAISGLMGSFGNSQSDTTATTRNLNIIDENEEEPLQQQQKPKRKKFNRKSQKISPVQIIQQSAIEANPNNNNINLQNNNNINLQNSNIAQNPGLEAVDLIENTNNNIEKQNKNKKNAKQTYQAMISKIKMTKMQHKSLKK